MKASRAKLSLAKTDTTPVPAPVEPPVLRIVPETPVPAILEFQHKPRMAKATLDSVQPAVVVSLSAGAPVKTDYASVSRTARSSSDSLNGLASQRQPLSSKKRSASVPATSPVTKMTRRASSGVAAAIAR